ncbi:MAG: hypothetical protein PHQ80_04380 [Candidatus ainarchaeum sp.]|nr:hypothetical protein [Candidatus ainarchaeum sp.]MDD5096471.1 hypothetical protein [Candidatus ainarchaeum sp.]
MKKRASTKKKAPARKAKNAAQAAPAAEQQPKASKELLEKRKRLMKEAEGALGFINSYPLLRKRAEVEAAKKLVLEAYSKGDDVVRQFIFFIIHEHLAKAANMRAMENFDFFKKVLGEKAEAMDVRKHVYRSMFNYSNSLEGTVELLLLLGDIGDTGAAKVISRHLSFYMSGEQQGLQLLRNAAVEALESCESIYALDVLITYAKYADKNERFIFALRDWEDKVKKSGLSAKDKDAYLSEMNDLMMVRKEKDVHYG